MYCTFSAEYSYKINRRTLVGLTSQASLDEKHLRFSAQTFTVEIIEVLDNVQNADWLSIARVQDSKFAVCEETADECIVV